MSAQFRSRRAFIVVLLSVLAFLVLPRAPPRTEPLRPESRPPQPSARTARRQTGGAQAINYFQQLAPQERRHADSARRRNSRRPAAGRPAAQSMVADEAAMDRRGPDAAGEAADAVASRDHRPRGGGRGRDPGAVQHRGPMPGGPRRSAPSATGYVIGTGAKALYLRFFGGEDPNTEPRHHQQRHLDVLGRAPTTTGSPATPDPVVHPGEWYLGLGRGEPVRLQLLQLRLARQQSSGKHVPFGIVQPRFGDRPLRHDALPLQQQPTAADRGLHPDARDVHRAPPAPGGPPARPDTTGSTTVPAPPTPVALGLRGRRHRRPQRSGLRPSCASGWSISWPPRCHADPTKDLVNVPERAGRRVRGALSRPASPASGSSPTTGRAARRRPGRRAWRTPVWSNPGGRRDGRAGTRAIEVYVNPSNSVRRTRHDEHCQPRRLADARRPRRRAAWLPAAGPRMQPRPNQPPRGTLATTCSTTGHAGSASVGDT